MIDPSVLEELRKDIEKKEKWFMPESELDDNQRYMLYSKSSKLIAEGSAGSGKTLLALHRLHRTIEGNNENVLFVVFTSTLKEYIESGISELLKSSLGQADILYIEKLKKENIKEKIKDNFYDYVIVDEVQDVPERILKKLVGAAKKGVILFGDDAQQIYYRIETGISIDEIKERVFESDVDHIKLEHNYRVPREVMKFSEMIVSGSGDLVEKCKNNIGTITINKLSDKKEEILYIYNTIIDKGLKDVVVLYPKNEDVDTASDIFKEIDKEFLIETKSGKLSDNLNFETDLPKIMTFHSSKGLEFKDVFIPSCNQIENFIPEQFRRAFYVATTRTNENLYLTYYEDTQNDAMKEIRKYKERYI
ncbi:3'-5' exonuclease [Tissierella sp. MB52-C2]|uniref:3'-5' exonuclease n=1 Tax=Tissierella sp. MB52-C2 TaxID=3070999 RepID=UPI00280B662C|nr:3'-5' exonuclease [Tissierella sp. MB52-C2]WMM26712.1 3'-5' exonuclease [Tissierella sp. MB52-C2]